MTNKLDLSRLLPTKAMAGEDDDDLRLLEKMLGSAERYLESFDWCPQISEKYFGCGVGGIVAVFLFRFSVPIDNSDDCLWVIDGDCPSAYLVADEAPNPIAALNIYCDIMFEWSQAVLNRTSLEEVFPVDAAASAANAEMLLSRIRFIRESVIPKLNT